MEKRIQQITGIAAWTLSAIFTAVLLFSIAPATLPGRALAASIALVLEGGKIVAWRSGSGRRLIALGLVGVSLCGSVASVILLGGEYRDAQAQAADIKTREGVTYRAQSAALASLDAEIAALGDKIARLPPDYVTASLKLSAQLGALRQERARLVAELVSPSEKTKRLGDIFSILGDVFGLPPETILVSIGIAIAILIEALGVALSGMDTTTQKVVTSSLRLARRDTENDVKRFAQALSSGARWPILVGRIKAAKEAGITDYQGRLLLSKLSRAGIVGPSPDGSASVSNVADRADFVAQAEKM